MNLWKGEFIMRKNVKIIVGVVVLILVLVVGSFVGLIINRTNDHKFGRYVSTEGPWGMTATWVSEDSASYLVCKKENFLVSIMYTQLFNLLCTIADDEYHGKLPVHVRCILDEFANIGQIPKFDKLIATIRSREISASIILQSKAQLKSIYKDNAETIEGNCDTFLFLGGKEKSTLKDLSEVLGKETIDTYNTSDTRGTSQSYGLNYQKLGRELMSQDRLALMDGGKCILQVRGVRPFFSDKVDITANEMYKELSDFDKKNQFDIEKYVSEYGKPKFSKII